MSEGASPTDRGSRWRTWLALGRVSNLPTVGTNVLAGIALAGGDPGAATLLTLSLALACFYTGGMFLNDAFDRGFDAQFRPERPIPSGRASASTVFAAGFGLLAAAELLLALAVPHGAPARRTALGCGAALAGLITYYNWRHKTDPLAPLVMGLCRALVYFTSAAVVSHLAFARPVVLGAAVLTGYVTALSWVARRESGREAVPAVRPPTVMWLVAGISIVDATLIATIAGQFGWAVLAAVGFVLTRLLQRFVAGS